MSVYDPENQKEHYLRKTAKVKLTGLPPESILTCACCGKNIFEDDPRHAEVITHYTRSQKGYGRRIERIYVCHRGDCEKKISSEAEKDMTLLTMRTLEAYMVPQLRVVHELRLAHQFHLGAEYSDEAIRDLANLLIATAPYVMRRPRKCDTEFYQDTEDKYSLETDYEKYMFPDKEMEEKS